MAVGVYKHYLHQGFQKGYIPWNKGTKGVMKSWNKGLKLSLEHCKKLSQARKGKKYKGGWKLSEETKRKISIAKKGMKRWWSSPSEFKSGELHPNWNLNREEVKRNLRNDGEYQQWVKKVKNRDDWRCKINNGDCFGYLIVHHILNWSKYPELRYEVNNGITLCQAHHPRKRAKEIQLENYFKNLIGLSV